MFVSGAKSEKGVIITEVEKDGLAEKAGVEEGDVILEIDKKPVENKEDFDKAMSAADLKEGVLLVLEHDGSSRFVLISSAN